MPTAAIESNRGFTVARHRWRARVVRTLFVSVLAGCQPRFERLIDVPLWVETRDENCWVDTVVEWPMEYWAEQVNVSCRDTDVETFFERDGVCYYVNGTCTDWKQDRAVTVCTEFTSCCAESAQCIDDEPTP